MLYFRNPKRRRSYGSTFGPVRAKGTGLAGMLPKDTFFRVLFQLVCFSPPPNPFPFFTLCIWLECMKVLKVLNGYFGDEVEMKNEWYPSVNFHSSGLNVCVFFPPSTHCWYSPYCRCEDGLKMCRYIIVQGDTIVLYNIQSLVAFNGGVFWTTVL